MPQNTILYISNEFSVAPTQLTAAGEQSERNNNKEEEEIKTFVSSLIKIVMVIVDDGTNKICNENEFILH